MRQPLLPVVVAYAAGVLVGGWAAPGLPLLFAAAALLLGLAMARSGWRPVLLLPLFFATGWVSQVARSTPVSPLDLRHLHDGEPALVRLTGVLTADPEERSSDRNGRVFWRTRVVVRVISMDRDGWDQAAHGRVMASLPGRLPLEYGRGGRVAIYGVLQRPAGPAVEGLFDQARHLAAKGVHRELATQRVSDWTLLDEKPPVRSLADRFRTWARANLARGLPEGDGVVPLLWAMALGWRTALTPEVAEPFMRSGTMHLFAISGLHIALVAGVLVAGLRVLQIPRGGCGTIAIPALWFYAAATGWQASAVRATIMTSVIILGWSLRRPPNLLNSLSAAALIILIWEPGQLFQASFQLSFFVVLSLALLLPAFEQLRRRWVRVDPFLPTALLTRWQRVLHRSTTWLAGSVAVSTAAWLGSLPLIAHYFHLLTPVSLVVNVVMVHLGMLALTSVAGSLLTGAWATGVAVLFNHSAWFWMSCMVWISERAASLPGAWWQVPSPGWSRILAWYGLLAACFGGELWRHGRRRWLIPTLGIAMAVVAVPAWWARDTVRITVAAPGGGSVIWIDAPGRARDLLVDCGDEPAVDRLTRPLLASRGVNRLGCLLLTHGDVRHVGGAARLNASLPIDRVVVSPHRSRSPPYRAFLAGLTNPPPRLERRVRGDDLAGWRVVHPGVNEDFPRADDKPLVLYGTFHGVTLLLLSDLGELGQEALLASGERLRADIVVTGLPANGEALTEPLLRAIEPQLVVVTDAAWPASQKVNDAWLQRIAAAGATVLPLSEAGAVTLELRRSGWRVRPLRGSGAGRSDGAEPSAPSIIEVSRERSPAPPPGRTATPSHGNRAWPAQDWIASFSSASRSPSRRSRFVRAATRRTYCP